MSTGQGAETGFTTMRGRNYPALRQFTVFLENRVGQLQEIVRRFEGSQLRICAISIHDSTECAIVRFILNKPEQGREVVERAGLPLVETDLIGVELPESDNPLSAVCAALMQAEINIVQAYPLLVRPHGNAALALMVDNVDAALETLSAKGFVLVTEGDLDADLP
jgi:hypothetical protein